MKITKRITAFCLALLMMLGLFYIVDLPVGTLEVVAQPAAPREGFTLVPTSFGHTGVETTSTFVMTSEADVLPNLSIDGQPKPDVVRTGAGEFYITPALPMRANSVYIFRVVRDGELDITWAFQTSKNFEILSTLPANQGVSVPVDIGVEINFSLDGFADLDDYFTIYPHVEGRFIRDGGLAIFMPTRPLAYGQVYTVTIDGALGLTGMNQTLGHEHVLSFETMPADGMTVHNSLLYPRVHLSHSLVEFPTFEVARIGFRSHSGSNDNYTYVDFDVYRLNNTEQAIDAINQITNFPSWSHFAWTKNQVSTRGLQHVFSFDAPSPVSRWGTAWVDLPDLLPPGFYLINATIGDFVAQMVLQVSDLAVQVVADDLSAIVWVNDMTTGMPATGAGVLDGEAGNLYTTDQDGIAVISRGLDDVRGDFLRITATDDKEVIVITPSMPSWGWSSNSLPNDDYWTILQLDRTLFSRRDTLNFWGFAYARDANGEDTRYLTATIAQRGSIMHRQAVAVENGGFHGEITLPNLDIGFYSLTISDGDTNISQIFFNVDDFVLPPYQMHVSANQVAIFAGEEATFTTRAEFFEGTPVSELGVSYHFSGWNLQNNNSGQGQTGIDGDFVLSSGAVLPNVDAQGQATLHFRAEATLPEIGRTIQQASVRVFINDIDVAVATSRDGADATVSVNVHNITLDRLNNGTNRHFRDFLCDPVAGQVVSATVSRVYWQAERTGEVYDFVQRRVVPTYRHHRREEIIDNFTLTTDADGYSRYDFTVPDRPRESYRISLTTTDGNGHTIAHDRFIGRDWDSFFWDAGSNQMNLYVEGSEERTNGYSLGEDVSLAVRSGVTPVTQGRTLFVMVQNSILTHHVGDNYFNFTFDEEHLPNVGIRAFYFNGHTYYHSWRMQHNLRFNHEGRNLNIEVVADAESYRPSGTATLTITTTDNEGNPRPANVNISLVDEALFALRDYTVDTLSALYRMVNTNLRFTRATHRTFVSEGIQEDAELLELRQEMGLSDEMSTMAPTASMDVASEAAEETHLRQTFEETALFLSTTTDERGIATIIFQLPDNITSWRVTASAFTSDFYAGNQVDNLIVTQPMFVHYTLGSTFLVGDMPWVGLNAFGTSFDGSETVEFRVWNEDTPEIVHTATASPFERINIPLAPKTSEGDGAIIIHATASNGFSDAVRHAYTVVASHRLVDTALFYDVTVDTVFAMGTDGMASITFADHGRGQFLHQLMGMRFARGDRLEGLVMAREANRIIEENFPDTHLRAVPSFDPSIYQRPDGGLAMLPFADSNLATTIAMMPFVMDDINLHALRTYLYNIAYGERGENKMLALYGLAMLRHPVLLDLERYLLLDGLSVVDLAYIALGFVALGETTAASAIYNDRILPHIQAIAPFYRVYTGTTHADIVEATSVVSLLASQLGKPERFGLHNYSVNNQPHHFQTDPMPNAINRLTFIANEIDRLDDTSASITYTLFGQEFTRNLTGRHGFTLRLPAENLHHFNLTDVQGSVGAVSIHRVPLEDIDTTDNNITIIREFFVAGTDYPTTTFNQDDLVRVVITVTHAGTDVHGSYQITDFLPAGLAHVPNSARLPVRTTGWWRATAQGRTVSFFHHNSRFDEGRTRTYVYYARIIGTGTFTAEGTMLQSLTASNYIAIGESTTITILD